MSIEDLYTRNKRYLVICYLYLTWAIMQGDGAG